ncbi:hypothetical protein QA612_17320 [Evansella sp. AB-P1]|uniref:hypothetical protein n=1 Tax=Evansella sp. AB-P1 TaxID=3037653 RepID=UPI00241F74AB|nr:hypothetical protein [Evansella sp. AB-P1]MDG5789222.1 hypothetical protein [Evansella sp. AB-P1]
MAAIEVLHKKGKIFEELFGEMSIILETTNYYNHPETKYDKFLLTVKTKVNYAEEEIVGAVTSINGAIHKTIVRLFQRHIPPQEIGYACNIPLFTIDVVDYFASDDWHREFPDFLLDSIKQKVTTIDTRDAAGQWIDYRFKVRNLYYFRSVHGN